MSLIQTRINEVRGKLAQWEIDAVLISSAVNRRWLTGFTGSLGYVMITADKAVLATDGRYWTQVENQCPEMTLYEYVRGNGSLGRFVDSIGVKRIGVEAEHMTLSEFGRLRKAQGVTWIALAKTVESMRDVKNSAEISAITKAAQITDLAMSQVNQVAKPGMTERALAWQLEKLMREHGADGLAFDTIVASGPNGAKPHHRPSDRALQVGDTITIDMGAKLDGFYSDLTRAFYLGDTPSDRFWEMYNLVLKAHNTAIDNMKAGMISADVDALARDVIEAAGYGDYFMHSLGHGVGLEIHEGPPLSYTKLEDVIPANAVVTVEPGIYIAGETGLRIEDLVLVKEDSVAYISQCPKIPIIPTT